MQPTKKAKLFSVSLMMLTAVFLAPNYSCSQSSAQPASLDGRSFTIVSMEKGKPETAELETMQFKDGMMDNEGCHIWGFGARCIPMRRRRKGWRMMTRDARPCARTSLTAVRASIPPSATPRMTERDPNRPLCVDVKNMPGTDALAMLRRPASKRLIK